METPTTVWIVTEGCYSDYHIEGVFSSRELAEAYAQTIKGGEVNIAEWDVDAQSKTVWRRAHVVHLSAETGEVVDTCTFDTHVSPATRGWAESRAYGDDPPSRGVFMAESYISPEHALKLAVEARQAWLRQESAVA